MDAITIVLRLIHIFAGVFWAGSTLTLAGFVEPAARAAGPEGARFIQRLAGQTRFTFFAGLAAPLTILAGLALYWRDSGLRPEWILTPSGLGFTVGGLAGIIAFVLGFAVMAPTSGQVAALGKEMQAAGGPPNPAQVTKMQALQEKLHNGGIWEAVLLAIAVIAMATARYL
jgi:uncharacterized membrane protein